MITAWLKRQRRIAEENEKKYPLKSVWGKIYPTSEIGKLCKYIALANDLEDKTIETWLRIILRKNKS